MRRDFTGVRRTILRAWLWRSVTFIEGAAHSGDMARRGTAAASDQLHACPRETHSIVREVIGCGDVEETIVDARGQARVGLRREEARRGCVAAGLLRLGY